MLIDRETFSGFDMIEDEALFDFPTFNIVISILQAQSAAYVNFNIRIYKIILRSDAGNYARPSKVRIRAIRT